MQAPFFDEYTLWLEPQGAPGQVLEKHIFEHAHKAHTPFFKPHVTLLGELHIPEADIIAHLGVLVKNQKPFSILSGEIGSGDVYHKAVFLSCDSPELTMLHEITKEHFSMQVLWDPHVSLVYGYLSASEKEELLSHARMATMPESFMVNSVSLWHAYGPPGEWRKVIELPFV